MKKKILIPILLLCASTSSAITTDNIRFHNETSDTTRITALLIEASKIKNPQERIAEIGKQFIGTPYVAYTLEGEKEQLTINLDELDCTTFVETTMAIAYTAGEGRTSWHDFIYNLERLRYRNGQINGYASRLHYISNWIVDNTHRGNFNEVTNLFPKYNYIERSISFMTENREKYTAMKDSTVYANIKNIELGYSNHRFPYIKTIDLNRKETKQAIREGDIIALVTNMKNLDVTHMGIVVKENGEPYLLHASSNNGKVEISKLPLYEFMKRNRSLSGIRVIRLKD